jgi:ATP-dependent Clp protease ATP-binding subunit ClpA
MGLLPLHETVIVPDLKKLSDYLKSEIVGQERAIKNIIRSFNMFLADLLPENRPIANLFFAGPTGVGKTSIAKALANYLFEQEKERGIKKPNPPLVRVDCGALARDFALTPLIGAPPGYVGSKQAEGSTPPLISKRNFPLDRITVLLFDEFEKAYLESHDNGAALTGLLMTVLDEGYLRNNWGEVVNLTQAIIIFSSNVGAREIVESARRREIGFKFDEIDQFEEKKEKTRDQFGEREIAILNDQIFNLVIKKYEKVFPPEFRNRIDRPVIFHFLSRENYITILEREILLLQNRINRSYGLLLRYTNDAKEFLLGKVIFEDGARSLQRAILREVVDPLTTYLNSGLVGNGDIVEVSAGNDRLMFKVDKNQSKNIVKGP